MSDDDVVLVEIDGPVATVTLHRPAARNALDRALRKALPTTLRNLDGRDDVAAIVLTGADPAFCAGLDLKELAAGGSALRETGATGEPAAERRGPFPEMDTPVIGAINGVAITGGFEVALACDFLVASERARFADTHARVGVMPGWGLTVLLAEAVGVRRARELSYSGNFLDARDALTWGLVNHVVPHEDLLSFCRRLAADIVGNDQPGVQRMRATYSAVTAVASGEGWQVEHRMGAEWAAERMDLSQVESRRRAIVERGRSQL